MKSMKSSRIQFARGFSQNILTDLALIHILYPHTVRAMQTKSNREPVNVLPVQPGEQTLGGGDEVDHRGQQIVGQPPRGSALRLAAPAAAGNEVLQVLGRGAELVSQSPDALRLQT